jgi:hypothetical protein
MKNWSTRPKEEQDLRLRMVAEIAPLNGASAEEVEKKITMLYEQDKIDPIYWADLIRYHCGDAIFDEARVLYIRNRNKATA